jgi:hypothetical protein
MTSYMQASSPGELCVYFLKPGLLFSGSYLVMFVLCTEWAGPYLYYKCIILHDQTL